MINSIGFPYNDGNKFRLMLLVPDDFNGRLIFLGQHLKCSYRFPHLILVITFFLARILKRGCCFDKGTFGKGKFKSMLI